MKKILLPAVLLLFSSLVEAKPRTLAFADSLFKAYLVSNFDANNDGEIDEQEALNIKIVTIRHPLDYRIRNNLPLLRSLSGIEHLVNLTELTCQGTFVTSLDLRKNKKLEILRFGGGSILSEAEVRRVQSDIVSLDLGGCPELRILEITERYNLKELDVTRNPKLKTLHCQSEIVERLDLSRNSELEQLGLRIDNFTRLDISKNIHIKQLSLSSWTPGKGICELDLRHQPGLEKLNLSHTAIDTLDLSGNPHLTRLDFDSDAIRVLKLGEKEELTGITWFRPLLRCIDLSACPNLEWTFIRYAEALDEIIFPENNKLTTIQCMDNNLSRLDVSRCPALAFLNCSSNRLTELDLTKNQNLTYLSCEYNRLTSLDLNTNPGITAFRCSGNKISALDVSKLAVLETLYCTNNKIGNLSLENNPSLKKLRCNHNELPGLDLSNNPKIETLSCNKNRIKVLNLTNMSGLFSLNCGCNPLETLLVDGCRGLYYLDCHNCLLSSLDITTATHLNELKCNDPVNALTIYATPEQRAKEVIKTVSDQITVVIR